MALKLENITYKNIINDINYIFENGKIYTILSSNEVEKEVLGKIIANLIKDYSGKVICDYSKDNINYVPKYSEEILTGDTFYEELSLSLSKYNYKIETINKKIDGIIKMLYLDEKIKNINSNDLSSGERKLLSLGVTLITNPKILVLNEPTMFLDSYNRKKVIKLLKKIAKRYNKIIIILTDDVILCNEISDTFILLKNGNIVGEGKNKELVKNDEELFKCGITIPKIINFINTAYKKKNISLDKTYDIKELMKDVYRNVK